MAADDPKLSLQQELDRKQGLERDLLTEILVSRRNAWRVAIGAVIVSLLWITTERIAPSKVLVPPIVVRVDEAKGEIEHVTQLNNGQEDYGERMARYFLQQYVLACESYDWNTIQNNYDRCGLFSSPDVQRAYYAKFQDNPRTGEKSLDKRYGKQTRVLIKVRSITPGPKHTATVRFTRRIESDNVPPTSEQLIATLAYQYVNTPITESIGRDNPLGFQVTTYTTDTEIVK